MWQKKGTGLLGWEWFYMFGLLRCMNGSGGLCVRNAACLTTVVARLFWSVLWGIFVLVQVMRRGIKTFMHSCEEFTYVFCAKMSH